MAFADETPSSNRIASIAVVFALHAFFAWLFISGLAVKVIKTVTGPIEILDIKEPPPPEEPPPPPKELEKIPPFVPPPEVDVSLPPPPVAAPVVVQQAVPAPEPPRVTPPPLPPPPVKQIVRVNIDPREFAAQLKRKFSGEIPDSVKRQMEADNVAESRVRCKVFVSESGAVTDAQCKSDRYPKLEDQTVRSLKRFKFPPAMEDGKPVGSWVDLPSTVVYRLVEG